MKKLLLIFTCFLLMTVANASPDAAVIDLTQLLQNIHSMRADFTQSSRSVKGKMMQRATGKMFMQRPGRFRWDVQKPMPQLIVANAKTLWIYDADLSQVTIRQFHYESGEAPALLLSHDDNALEKNFTVKAIQKNSNDKWFSLTPKKADSMYENIQLRLNNGKIQTMVMKDNLGNQTTIEFNKVETNIPLTPSLFQFKTPHGVDVIDERKKQA